MELEGGKAQDTLIPCKIFRGKAERHLAEENGAEISPSHMSWCRAVSWREGHLHSPALGRWSGAVETSLQCRDRDLDSQHVNFPEPLSTGFATSWGF